MSRYLAISVSMSRSTGYRSLCCLNCLNGCVLVSNDSIIPTTRVSSHFPSSSNACNAFAHDPRPSVSSVRERMKSQRRFPVCCQQKVELEYPRGLVGASSLHKPPRRLLLRIADLKISGVWHMRIQNSEQSFHKELTYVAEVTGSFEMWQQVLLPNTTWLRPCQSCLESCTIAIHFDLVAPSSLLRYSPRSVTRLISFKLPSFNPGHYQHASNHAPPKLHTYASHFLELW